MASMQSKRKRESQDIGTMRTAPTMNQEAHEFDQHYLQTDVDGMDGTIDFSSMVNNPGDVADVGDVQHDPNHLQAHGGEAGANNADTAAAAIAQYHTMTVPQSTEQSFMTQPTEGGDRHGISGEQGVPNAQQRTSSFGDFDASGAQSSPNGDKSPNEGMESLHPGSNKPTVGSDEWHKIRKDNHKEGKNMFPCKLSHSSLMLRS
jgi:bHLH factor